MLRMRIEKTAIEVCKVLRPILIERKNSHAKEDANRFNGSGQKLIPKSAT